MSTAYEEALKDLDRGNSNSVPAYINSADTLSIANRNSSFVDSAADTIDSVQKFIGLSVISGANQLYNIAPSVGNLLGGDYELRDTGDVVAEMDRDLGKFYEEHQAGIDLVGFIASSVVPGTAGIKVLNAGQRGLQAAIGAGKFGPKMGRAMGLLVPSRRKTLAKAVEQVRTSSSTASLLHKDAIRAIGAGAGQNVLEATAAEIAIASTMFESPVLDDMSMGDLVVNIAFGAGLAGMIGTGISAAQVNSALKGGLDEASKFARPWTSIREVPAKAGIDHKIVNDLEQINNVPPVPPLAGGNANEVISSLKSKAETKVNTLKTRFRGNLGQLTGAQKKGRKIKGGDQELATSLYHWMYPAKYDDQQAFFIGLKEASRLADSAPIFKKLSATAKKAAKGDLKATEDLMVGEFENISTGYTRLWGDGAGEVLGEQPKVLFLSDTLKAGQKIEVKGGVVTAGNKRFKHSLAYNKVTGASKQRKNQTSWRAGRAKVTPFETQARYIWAQNLDRFDLGPTKKMQFDVEDFPLMEKVLKEVSEEDFNKHVTLTGLKEGEAYPTYGELQDFIGDRKMMVANRKAIASGADDIASADKLTQEEIAAIIDVRPKFLSGELTIDSNNRYSADDIFGQSSYNKEHSQFLRDRGFLGEADPDIAVWNSPQHARLTYDTTDLNGIGSTFVTENMVIIKEQQKMYQDSTAVAAAEALGEEFYGRLVDINSGHVYSGAVPSGAGASFLGAASHNYGSLASWVEDIGAVATDAINVTKKRARNALTPLLYNLSNKPEAAIEWSTLHANVRSVPMSYGLNEAGDALEPMVMINWRKMAAKAKEAGEEAPPIPTLPARTPERFPLKSAEVRELARAHIELNGNRTIKHAKIKTSQGALYNRDPEAFYPLPVNPKDYPYFALVTDESITATGHHRTLYATSAQELEDQITKLRSNKHLKIRTKKEAEDYYDAIGRWSYEKTISSNYLDNEAARKGISAPYLVATDPKKIVDDTLSWHLQRETGLVREAIGAKYEVQFEELRRLGDEFTNAGTSQFSNLSLQEYAEDVIENPFADYIKTALAISKNEQYPIWRNINKSADVAISRMYNRITQVFNSSPSLDDAAREINPILERAGYKGAHYDSSMEIFANATPDRGVLSTAVQKANSMLATIVLRWDTLNAVNNAVSANVLLGAETKAVIRAISRGDEEAAGALAKLMKINTPGVEGASQFTAGKMIANSMARFHGDKEALEFYKKNGYLTSIADQYRDSLDTLAFTGKESISGWNSRLNETFHKLGNKGERLTGNKVAEEFNRFVAADVMKQMTDVAVTRGLMTTKEQLSYIRTFVNRTQGNYLASQRPLMFKGPVGQAIGLFQTYQFNLMQQLLRHVGEGTGKDAMTLLALQGTIHGMNGLPGFHAVNQHIVGNASGNTEHKDLYDAAYSVLGKEAGDWFTYGAGSNFLGLIDPDLKTNLYTRGDINPRHVTLIPTNPADVPIVQSYGRFVGNIVNSYKQLAAGADISATLLRGLEHNGISRPLAGIATTLKGLNNPEWASYTTSKKGNVIASNDLLHIANLTRIVGGKPMDEAVAIDAMYRYKAYALKDSKRRNILGQAIKSTMLAGQSPTTEQINDFAAKYVEMGGRQEEFSKWVTQLYKSANLSQANKLQQDVGNKFSESMQLIMGGEELNDFY